MEEITITRALAELKLLDSRIHKKIVESTFMFLLSKKQKNLNMENLSRSSVSNLQSIEDLIERRKRIKNGIIISNATTKVKFNGKEVTVAEVIESKQLLEYYNSLVDKLKRDRESVMTQVERQNQIMENDLQKILEINFGKSSNLKTNSDDIENISKTYREHNRTEVIDCIKIDEKIREIEEIISSIETESNFVLSESNAITKIRV